MTRWAILIYTTRVERKQNADELNSTLSFGFLNPFWGDKFSYEVLLKFDCNHRNELYTNCAQNKPFKQLVA